MLIYDQGPYKIGENMISAKQARELSNEVEKVLKTKKEIHSHIKLLASLGFQNASFYLEDTRLVDLLKQSGFRFVMKQNGNSTNYLVELEW